MKKTILISLILTLLIVSCKNDEDILTSHVLSGEVEKGPFIQGSTITVHELDKSLTLTGRSFQTTISSNDGSFSLNSIELVSPYVQIGCDGYFYNEVTGELSKSPIHLESIVDLTNKQSVKVNILTHLSENRIKRLMTSKNIPFAEAFSKTREELLHCFGLQAYKDKDFNEFSIANGNAESGALIMISSILLKDRTEAQLTEFLAKVESTFSDTGTLPDSIIQTLREESYLLETDQIKNHIIDRYKELGKDINIPELSHFIDWDGDGVAGNELGDPNVARELSFEKDTINVGNEGGRIAIKINSNVPYTFRNVDNVPILTTNSLKSNIIFTKTIEKGELILNVQPSKGQFMNPEVISVYTYDGKDKANLVLKQDGDLSKGLTGAIFNVTVADLVKAMDYTYTAEALYSGTYSVTNSNSWYPFCTHKFNSSNSYISSAWSNLYKVNRNLITIDQLFNDKKALSYTISLRALIYYHLITLWGDVPFVDDPSILNGSWSIIRMKKADIYALLKPILESAIINLPQNESDPYFIVSRNVPKALLAKIKMQEGLYDQALILLQEIIESGDYNLSTSREKSLSEGSNELVFAIDLKSNPMTNYSQWIESNQYLPLISYSELLLLASECSDKLGKVSTACNYLNQLLNRDGKPIASQNDFNSKLKDAWKNTVKGGFSYFDFLKRNGFAVTELGIQTYQQLFPIPMNEIMLNPNMIQNPGY